MDGVFFMMPTSFPPLMYDVTIAICAVVVIYTSREIFFSRSTRAEVVIGSLRTRTFKVLVLQSNTFNHV